MPQRTKLQAYQHVLDSVTAGRVDPQRMFNCQYRQRLPGGGQLNCGVGCLFNEAQLNDIEKRKLNHELVDELGNEIGLKNITEVTGLGLDELTELQLQHDNRSAASFAQFHDFRNFLKKKIKALTKM